MANDSEGPGYVVTDNELANRVGRTTNSALKRLLLSLKALVIMFVKEHKTFLYSKKKNTNRYTEEGASTGDRNENNKN